MLHARRDSTVPRHQSRLPVLGQGRQEFDFEVSSRSYALFDELGEFRMNIGPPLPSAPEGVSSSGRAVNVRKVVPRVEVALVEAARLINWRPDVTASREESVPRVEG